MPLGVGVDVGGTKIAACVADVLTGRIVTWEQVPTTQGSGGRALLARAVSLVENLAADKEVTTIGVGICELVDLNRRVASAYTVDWRDLDVEAAFGKIAPARVESDVRAAALAEARFGAARDVSRPWIHLTVGTGISYCLMIGAQPYAGAHGNALLVGAPMVEGVSSGLALQNAAGLRSAEEVLSDERFGPLVARATGRLGLAMAALVNALDPALVVIGGGLGLETSYREAAVKAMREAVELPIAREIPVVPAQLGKVGGALGAALVGAVPEPATPNTRSTS